MSALTLKADMDWRSLLVRDLPKGDIIEGSSIRSRVAVAGIEVRIEIRESFRILTPMRSEYDSVSALLTFKDH
jgi:hypothetical protein